jgi:hypothetical protein
LFIEHHISWGDALAAAVSGIDVPIAAAIIIARRVAQDASGVVDGAGKAFEFEECSGGSLVKLDSET